MNRFFRSIVGCQNRSTVRAKYCLALRSGEMGGFSSWGEMRADYLKIKTVRGGMNETNEGIGDPHDCARERGYLAAGRALL